MVDDDWLRRAESAIKQLYENPIILTPSGRDHDIGLAFLNLAAILEGHYDRAREQRWLGCSEQQVSPR